MIHELLWFLRGSTNIRDLVQQGVMIWNEWPFRYYLQSTNQPVPEVNSDAWHSGMRAFVERVRTDADFAARTASSGRCTGISGARGRTEGRHIDQIRAIVDQIVRTPDSRRIIVSAWNVADLEPWRPPGCRRAIACFSST